MTLEEWVKKNKPQQYQQLQNQPTKTFRENVTGVRTAEPVEKTTPKQSVGRMNKVDYDIESNVNDIPKLPKIKKPVLNMSRERIDYLTDPKKQLSSAELQEAKDITKSLQSTLRKQRWNWNVLKSPEYAQTQMDIQALQTKTSPAAQAVAGAFRFLGAEALTKKTEQFIEKHPTISKDLPQYQGVWARPSDIYSSAEKQNPIAFGIGEVIGGLSGYGAITKALSAIPKVGAALNSGSVVKRIAAASAVNLPMDIASAGIYSNGDEGEFAKQLGLNVGLGVVAGGAIEGVGKLASKVKVGKAKALSPRLELNEQAFDRYSGTPEGALVKAQRDLDSAKRNIEKKTPSKIREVEERADAILNIVETSGKEASLEAAKLIHKSRTKYTRGLKKATYHAGVDLNQILKQNKGDQDKLLQNVSDYLTTKKGVNEGQAKLLSEHIVKKYHETLDQKMGSKLDQMFKGRHKKVNEAMELIHMGAHDAEDLKNLIMQRSGIPVLTNEDTKNILEYMTEAQKHAEGSDERKIWESKAEQVVKDILPATLTEKFRSLQGISLLANPKALLTKNLVKNLGLAVLENAKDVPGTLIDKAVSMKTGERKTAFSLEGLMAQGQGFKQGLTDLKNDSLNKGATKLSKRIFENNSLNSLDQLAQKASHILEHPFYQMAYSGRLAELKRLGVTGEAAESQARAFALDRTCKNDSTLSIMRDNLNQKANGFPVGDLMMWVTQSPPNVMDKLLDYSPVGFGKALVQLGKSKKTGKFDQKLFVDRLSRSLTGTGIIMLGGVMAEKGLVTGDYDKNVQAAQNASGKQALAFKIGDRYHSLEAINPIGSLLSIGANAYQGSKDTKDFFDIIGAGTEAAVKTVFKPQFLNGIFDVANGKYVSENIGKTILGPLLQLTPAGIAGLSKTIDPYVRETYDPNFVVQEGKKLASGIPGISMVLPKKLNEFGKPLMQSQGRNLAARAFENFLSPGKLTTLQHKEVYEELERLYEQTGSPNVFPKGAEKSLDLNGVKVSLSAKDYEVVARTQGEIIDKNLKTLIQSEEYRKMSDQKKAESIALFYEYAHEVAKSKINGGIK